LRTPLVDFSTNSKSAPANDKKLFPYKSSPEALGDRIIFCIKRLKTLSNILKRYIEVLHDLTNTLTMVPP
jgi:hypothetical protein